MVRSLDYSIEVACESLCHLIASNDLPLNFVESKSFENYIRTEHNPRFCAVSRHTTTKNLVKYYNERHDKL